MRPVLLFTIATSASIPAVLPHLLENLASFRSTEQMDTYGRATTLAEHTIVGTTNLETQGACDTLANKHKQKCYELDHSYNSEVKDMLQLSKNKAHAYSVGLSRIKALVDLVSLGYDVLYFDLHHQFFHNPLKYLYAHTRAPVVVSSTPRTSCQQVTPGPDGSLPDDHHRLDMLFARSGPSVLRCMYNWLYWSCHTQHDVNEMPLDHHTFRHVMQECVAALGSSVISVEYLDPAAFPSECQTKCGCANQAVVELQPDGTCSKDVMSSWVAYMFSCSPTADEVGTQLARYSKMYQAAYQEIKD